MGQIINSTFKFGFQLTSIKLEPKIVRERQVLSTRFDGLKLFEFNIGSYSTTVNNILRRIGEISKIFNYYDTAAKNSSTEIQNWVTCFDSSVVMENREESISAEVLDNN